MKPNQDKELPIRLRRRTAGAILRTSLGLAWCACAGTGLAQVSHFDPISFDANQRPRLRLEGSAGTNYTVEQSVNLADWVSIYTGAATNGALEYLGAPANGSAAFYRARVASPPLQVHPRVDTNRVGIGLITREGGYCEVTALNGTRFKLTAASGAVADSVAVTMTVITNLAGVPGGGLFPAAVQFEPDGLQFIGAAMLEIEFPTNIPANQIASYAFGNAGNDFHLTPDLVATNRVLIPVTHFSAVGTTALTKQELANLITLSINKALDQLNHTVASEIDLARQDGSATLATVHDAFIPETRKFLQDNVLPYLEEAKHNCALFRQLMPQIYSLSGMAQLMGVESIPEVATAQAIVCDAFLNCEEEIFKQCREQGGNTGLLEDLIETDRACQLVGCPSTVTIASLANCMPLWIGTLTYTATGSTNDSSDSQCTQTWNSDFRFSGIVTNAEETDLGFFKLVTLYVFGDAYGLRTYESTCHDEGNCYPDLGSWSDDQHTLEKWVKAGKETALVSWYIYPTGTAQAFGITFARQAPCKLTLATQSKSTDCDGARSSSDNITSMDSTVGAYDYADMTGQGVTARTAAGSDTQTVLEAPGLSSVVTWTWDFHQK